tara:strand:- start:223 stop:492 length:270 start_codon:yes stop_codon:yes gene_type:complete
MIRNAINNVIKNLLHTNIGKIILSILLGLGLATLFRQMCDSKNCYNFIGPTQNEIRDKIFSFDSKNSKCYSVKESTVECGKKKKSIDFA